MVDIAIKILFLQNFLVLMESLKN